MHLLFATSIVPDGARGSGYEIANAALIDGLRRAGVRVTVVGFSWPGRAAERPHDTIVLGDVDVRTAAAPPLAKLTWLSRAFASGLTFSSAKLRVVGEAELSARIAQAGPFDAAVLNSVQLAGAFEQVLCGMPFLFVAHNVEHLSAAENARTAQGGLARLLFRREAAVLERLERRLCQRARFVLALTEEDRAALEPSGRRSAVLPLVVAEKVPAPPARRAPAFDAALIGTWTWEPNRVGLEWFLEEVAPRLPPTFRVGVAGAVPAAMKARHPQVEFAGRVPDARAFVLQGRVVPLVSRAGTGVQLKTIETFELGLSAVATSSALRGIGHRPSNCILADDPADFAEALAWQAANGADVDGRDFHARQRAELDRALRGALVSLPGAAAEAAA